MLLEVPLNLLIQYLTLFKISSQIMADQEVVGYIYLFVQTIKAQEATSPIHVHITLGQIAKVDTQPKLSGTPVNQVFLIQVPKKPARFVLNCMEGEKKLSQCRYDIKPFMDREGITHTIDSDLFNEDNKKAGIVRLKITYYSAVNGKLKVRIFHLEFHPDMVKEFKQAKVKVVCSIHAQSTDVKPLTEPFDQTVQVLLLKPSGSLIFEIVHEKGVLASYTINNIEQAGILSNEAKAYQVSLFNHGKAVGLIKYQLNWIK